MVLLKNRLAPVLLAASLFVVSCRNGQELAIVKGKTANNTVKTQNPQFIENVTVGGNANMSNVKLNIPKTENPAEAASVSNNPEIPAEMAVTTKNTLKNTSLNINNAEYNFISTKYSMILGVLPTAISNLSLYAFIDDWYGTRYRMGGTTKSGIDCSAFVQRLYESVFGASIVRTACEQFDACQRIFNESELREGDLVFFRIKSRRISHVGVYLANDYFVHASASQGVMISNLNEGYWSRFYAGAGKML
ncbi:MAG: C40 family peptidase [Flavipsychrobacter sp.]|nr:C40 family peptidase [Flavipsychrobacter sp.]